MTERNRYLDALKEAYNVVGLAAAASLSAATLSPIPLLAGLVIEAAYLLFVPDSGWYTARLSHRYDVEVEKRRRELKETVYPTLRPEMRERFARMESMRAGVAAQPVEDPAWFQTVLRKLDYLLDRFLTFAGKEAEFRQYLRSVLEETGGGNARERYDGDSGDREESRDPRGPRRIPINAPKDLSARPPSAGQTDEIDDPWVRKTCDELRARFEREIAEVRRLVDAESDASTKAVLEKRLDILDRRQEFVGKIAQILTNLTHQLKLLEETFGLINDEIRARSPEQVLADIDDVVWQADTMTKVLDEMAPYASAVARMTTR